ncbi:substrate-binding periplasmic protein [Pseudoalteromonas sp. A25]|uniref:substrate-binding periplasmic protein n=1 Tax=Pseudoalteromonas sp. A25 TaxID=116092 RepID=UPI001562CC01|nr:transporter substrate-binding domain-containing protein [Pseudoalteromonas sp. A25]
MIQSKPSIGAVDIYTEHFPPYQYRDVDGVVVGHATAMVRALMAKAKLDYKIYLLPWHRAKQQFEGSQGALIYSIARTVEREGLYHWLMPLCDLNVGFYKRVENTQNIASYSLDNLKQYVVGVGVAQPSLEFLRAQGFEDDKLVTLSSLNQAGGLLEKGRIDYLFGAQSFVEQMSRAMGTQNKWELVLDVPELSAKLYLAAHKNTPKNMLHKLTSAKEKLGEAKQNDKKACHTGRYIQKSLSTITDLQ